MTYHQFDAEVTKLSGLSIKGHGIAVLVMIAACLVLRVA